MRRLERYIGVSVLKATVMILLVLLSLLVFFGSIEELEDVGQGEYGTWDALFVGLLSAPRYAFEAFPVAALLGSLLGLGGLASHGELVAMRAAGMSLRQIVLAVLKAGLAMMLAVFAIGELVAPATEQFGQQYKAERQQQQVSLRSRYGFWARDGEAFINIRRILPGARLEDIYIYEFSPSRELTLSTHAEFAEHDGANWVLHRIRQSSISEDRVVSREVERATWSSLIDPGLLRLVVVQPNMLPLWGLYQYIGFLHANGLSAIGYEVAFWSKIATPVATLVMLIIAVPFVLGSLRSVGIGQRIFVGGMLGSLFYLLNRGLSYTAVVYDVSPWLAASLPAAAFLALGIYLLRRVH
jgi:lipopolysaccharide export system permease protein